jgi:hypothetical protein
MGIDSVDQSSYPADKGAWLGVKLSYIWNYHA